jgi:hypothetical protein
MLSKRKERPCDSVPADRRCRAWCHTRYGHTHARDEGNGAQLKAINGKLIAAETSFEKLRDKERLLVVPNQRCRRRS